MDEIIDIFEYSFFFCSPAILLNRRRNGGENIPRARQSFGDRRGLVCNVCLGMWVGVCVCIYAQCYRVSFQKTRRIRVGTAGGRSVAKIIIIVVNVVVVYIVVVIIVGDVFQLATQEGDLRL